MKIESLREVKNNLSSVIEQLESTGPVVITKNGKSRAILLPVGESTDLEKPTGETVDCTAVHRLKPVSPSC